MVIRVAERVSLSEASALYVVTDSTRIHYTVIQHGYSSLMTRHDHSTGTDRLSEAVNLLRLNNNSIVVNVQGDEPLIEPALINTVAKKIKEDPSIKIATCSCPIFDTETLLNPNVVKVVRRLDGRALYFSRSAVGYAANTSEMHQSNLGKEFPASRHIGIYSYRVSFLRCFPELSQGILERHERLEQLRALEHGYDIAVCHTGINHAAGIDTPEDLENLLEFLKHSKQ